MEILLLIFNIVIVALLALIAWLLFFRKTQSNIDAIVTSLEQNSEKQRDSVAKQISNDATEQFRRFDDFKDRVQTTLQSNRVEISKQLFDSQERLNHQLSLIQQSSADSIVKINDQVNKTLQDSRIETNNQLTSIRQSNTDSIKEVNTTLDTKMKSIQETLENKIKSLQEGNEKRLEQMQGVVDEKLQKTLETRLTLAFEQVSKQLDSVQQGLGEMKNLAADAKSLKNALINVKERGTYGEVRLEKLLSDILAPNQFEVNVEISNNKRVEFVVKLPGSGDEPLLLPIDSKFPIEDYNRLLDAEDKQAIDEARKSLAQKIRLFAKDINDKYIMPPKTTDFALMFLPTEGLYAEVVRNAALFEEVRDKFKITPVGPTTLSAFLGSLQMGFKTLAIEQRSQEVWETLRKVKAEFKNFGDVLDKAREKIQKADEDLEKLVGTRTRAINRTLRTVELGETDPVRLLESPEIADEDETN